MMRFSRFAAAAAIIVLFGAGCGGDKLFTSSGGDAATDPQYVNMQGDINKGQQAEQNWQAQIKE